MTVHAKMVLRPHFRPPDTRGMLDYAERQSRLCVLRASGPYPAGLLLRRMPTECGPFLGVFATARPRRAVQQARAGNQFRPIAYTLPVPLEVTADKETTTPVQDL